MLTAATLAAALFAVGAASWGLAERGKARDLQAEVRQALSNANGLSSVVNDLRLKLGIVANGYQAALYPGVRQQPAGTAVVFAPEGGNGFALVTVVSPLPGRTAPYRVVLVDRLGHSLVIGELTRDEGSGHLVLARLDLNPDLSKSGSMDLAALTTLNVVDRTGSPVLTGTFRPYVSS